MNDVYLRATVMLSCAGEKSGGYRLLSKTGGLLLGVEGGLAKAFHS